MSVFSLLYLGQFLSSTNICERKSNMFCVIAYDVHCTQGVFLNLTEAHDLAGLSPKVPVCGQRIFSKVEFREGRGPDLTSNSQLYHRLRSRKRKR